MSNRGSTKSRERPLKVTTRTGSRRQGPQKQEGKKTVAEEQPSDPPKAKKHKSVDSDEDDEEPQNEHGTSSNSQLAAPVLPKNLGDEDSEYSDEHSAQSRDSEWTLSHPDLYVLTNDEHWAMTPETHICSSSWIILFFNE